MLSSRRKILIASLGTRGDVQPYVALAQELASAGAEVVVITGEGFDDMIEAAGARSRPVPVNYQALLQDRDVQAALFTLKGKIKVARQNMDLQKDIARRLWASGLEERPDLILFNLKASVLTLVGRRLNVPALPTALQPVVEPTGDFPLPLFGLPDLGRFLNRLSFRAGRSLMQAGVRRLMAPVRAEAERRSSRPGSLCELAADRAAAMLGVVDVDVVARRRPEYRLNDVGSCARQADEVTVRPFLHRQRHEDAAGLPRTAFMDMHRGRLRDIRVAQIPADLVRLGVDRDSACASAVRIARTPRGGERDVERHLLGGGMAGTEGQRDGAGRDDGKGASDRSGAH